MKVRRLVTPLYLKNLEEPIQINGMMVSETAKCVRKRILLTYHKNIQIDLSREVLIRFLQMNGR